MGKKIKYPGRLGKPTPVMFELVGLIKESASGGTYDRRHWLADYRLELMYELMKYYDISSTDEDKWMMLASALAQDHVPAFQFQYDFGPGRPRKSDPLTRLRHDEKRRGAPRKWSDEYYKDVLETVDREQAMLQRTSSRRVTTKAAIESVILKYVKDRKLKASKSKIKEVVSHFQKKHSEAKRRFKKSGNS